jgi:IS4 transposase
MRFSANTFSQLLQPIDRRAFARGAERLGADRYDKSFRSWDHFVALAFVHLSGADSLREAVSRWNARADQHYHLGTGRLSRSTFADANARRPCAVFAEAFAALAAGAGRTLRREGRAMLRLIDSTPLRLPQMCEWAACNARMHGLKMHVVYDPDADCPHRVEITPANVNDVVVGRKTPLEQDAVYVFDKAYYSFDWWAHIHAAGAFFVTRPKTNTRFETVRARPLERTRGEGFAVLADAEVALAGARAGARAMPLRRVRIERDVGKTLDILTNDMERSAHDIALLYKTRWDIELLFRWIKQHLKLKRFLGRCENAVRVQALAAMIVFLLLRIAARTHAIALAPLRLAELVADHLFARAPLARLGKPPDKPNPPVAQPELPYA